MRWTPELAASGATGVSAGVGVDVDPVIAGFVAVIVFTQVDTHDAVAAGSEGAAVAARRPSSSWLASSRGLFPLLDVTIGASAASCSR